MVLRELSADGVEVRRRSGDPALLQPRAHLLGERGGMVRGTARNAEDGVHQFFRAGIVSLKLGGPRSVEEKRGLPLRIPRGGGAAEVRPPGLRELLVAEVRAAEVEEQGVRVRDPAQDRLGAIEAAMVLHRVAQRRQLLGVEARQHGGMVESPAGALGSVVHRAAPQDGQGTIHVARLFREVRIQIASPLCIGLRVEEGHEVGQRFRGRQRGAVRDFVVDSLLAHR